MTKIFSAASGEAAQPRTRCKKQDIKSTDFLRHVTLSTELFSGWRSFVILLLQQQNIVQKLSATSGEAAQLDSLRNELKEHS
ncbi:hypothetical protein [Algoriphagus sp.]|uniref:hypothetical protein n=1 Tax=Algoriphagus sp. TaxID=1872435 RepID=UPI0039194BD8